MPTPDNYRYVVQHVPLKEKLSNDFDGVTVAIRRGMEIRVVLKKGDDEYIGDPIFQKDVWQRGVWLQFRPFYEKRLARVVEKAREVKAIGDLAIEAARSLS